MSFWGSKKLPEIILLGWITTIGIPDSFAQNASNTPITTVTPDNKTSSQPSSQPSSQSSQPTPLPNIMILPWQTPSIDADTLRRTRQARDEVVAQLKKSIAPNAASLDTLAPKAQSMTTARYLLKDTIADQTAGPSNPVALYPLWTRMHDHDLFALVIIDSARNTIRAIHHKVIPQSRWQAIIKSRRYEDYFTPGFSDLIKLLNLTSLPAVNNDIAVAFRDQTASSRANEIDRATIALMIASQWGSEISMINPFASELMATIHRFYGQSNAMRKANREVITRITYGKTPVNTKLPVTLTLDIRATEGVFGQTLPWMWTEPLTIGVKPDSTIDLQYSPRLKTELLTERSSLRRDELPQIAKIRGAWAYVDKGRAWGLQMNDRLISNDNPQKIKGHVVAYFGPEMNLKSPRGWPIHEGAIVFIRKGQKDIRVGQTLTYDGMKVPTPWPPSASGAK